MLFRSDLAGLIVSKRLWPRYDHVYGATHSPSTKKNHRRSVGHLLDQVRRFRNAVAHNKQFPEMEQSLLSLCFESIIDPIQAAFAAGRAPPPWGLEIHPGLLPGVPRSPLGPPCGASGRSWPALGRRWPGLGHPREPKGRRKWSHGLPNTPPRAILESKMVQNVSKS